MLVESVGGGLNGKARVRILAVVSGFEGLFFIAYGALVIIGVLRFGITGPAEVANAPGVTLEIVIFLVFGAALLLVATGWWRGSRWARSPFILAQLLGLVVSVPLMGSAGSAERMIGWSVTVIAVACVALSFTRPVTAHLYRGASEF